jgi:type IVB pilus formation R64 PilN family outer membrane protein
MTKKNQLFAVSWRTLAALAAISINLMGCQIAEVKQEQRNLGEQANQALGQADKTVAVGQIHQEAWLLGEKIPASKIAPESYSREVHYNSGSTSPSLSDIVAYLNNTVHIRAEIDPSVTEPLPGAKSVGLGQPNVASINSHSRMPDLPAGLATSLGTSTSSAIPVMEGPFRYDGNLGGFLSASASRFGIWSHFVDGKVSYYRIETRTFAISSLPDVSEMKGSISTGDGSDSSGTTNGSSQPTTAATPAGLNGGSSGGGSSGGGSGGQEMGLAIAISPWAKLQATAESLAGHTAVVTDDPNLGVLTVTGTPPQCDRVEQFVRSLDSMFSKQVAIDVHVYEIRTTGEDNYGLNLALAYKSHSGHTGANISTVSIPSVSSAATPMQFGATILSGPLSGSSVAVQALSTLGNVSEVVSRSGITQNGKLLALQSAQSVGYVESSSETLTASVGSTGSLQTGTLVPGFTSSFLPKVSDGRILIAFDMTLSDLLSLTTFTSGSGANESSVQLPTMQLARFEQSITLKPGESLVLTGMRQQNDSMTNNGVGTPSFARIL